MRSSSFHDRIIMELIFAVIFIVYNVVSEITNIRGSLGKRICGLKVVDADGRTLSIAKSLTRSIGAVTGYIFFPVGSIIVIISFFIGTHRQTWYERITNSFVIKVS